MCRTETYLIGYNIFKKDFLLKNKKNEKKNLFFCSKNTKGIKLR